MKLLQALRTSLSVFVLRNIVDIFKTVGTGLKSWFANCWWLIALYFVISASLIINDQCFLFEVLHRESSLRILDYVLKYSVHALWRLLLVAIAISIKKPDQKKRYRYYLHYCWHACIITLVILVVYGLISHFYYTQESMMIGRDGLIIFLRNAERMFGSMLIPLYFASSFYSVFGFLILVLAILVFIIILLDFRVCLGDMPQVVSNTICMMIYMAPILGIISIALFCLSLVESSIAYLIVVLVARSGADAAFVLFSLSFFINAILFFFVLSIISSAYTKLSRPDAQLVSDGNIV